jgi:hypothetical protein
LSSKFHQQLSAEDWIFRPWLEFIRFKVQECSGSIGDFCGLAVNLFERVGAAGRIALPGF